MATHSSTLAWEIPWTEKPGIQGYSPWGREESDVTEQLHIQLSLWQGCHRQKNLVSMHAGLLRSCPILCDPVDYGLPGFCQGGGSPGKYTGTYWPVLVAIVFQSTIFPAAPAANSPDYLVLPELLQPKQLHHLHTWPSQGQPKSSRAASGANPSGPPTCRAGNETTIETQGQCG